MKKNYLLFSILFLNCLIFQAQTVDVVTGLSEPNRLLINGNDLYYSTTSEVFKIDIRQDSPTPVSVVTGLNGAVGMVIDGNTLYIAENNVGRISKIDITDAVPTLERVITGIKNPNGLLLSGNTMYFSDPNRKTVYKFDITELRPTPVLVAFASREVFPLGMALQGDILYMAQGMANRVSKVDVTSGVTQPTDVVLGVTHPIGLRLVGNKLIIAELSGNKISVKDLANTDTTAEDLVIGVSRPADIEISGSTLFILEIGASKISKVENLLGVDGVAFKNKSALFPNPARSFIQVSNLKMATPYAIFSIIGSKLAEGVIKPNEPINIENLVTGVYVFKTQDGNAMRFVKE